jgi:hypothetical protein
MGGGGSSQPTTQNITQTNLPEYMRPYYEGLMQRAEANLATGYQTYGQERLADFTQDQRAVQNNILNMQAPGQFATGTNTAATVAQRALAQPAYTTGQFNPNNVSYQQQQANQMATAQTDYKPNLQAFQFGPTRDVGAQNVQAQNMQAAQSSYGQGPLEQFRVSGPQQFGAAQAQQYMSPYIQQALEPQMREAITSARRGQIAQDLGSSRQGTYGGSRQLLASLERERNLGQQLGDIQSRGMQSAYENAQQQFERDRAAGLTTGQQNLQAALEQQKLGVQTGTQMALANLSNEQQARVNNQAMQFQAQGMNADNALKAALANQGVDVTRSQANLQSQLGTQELGANIGMQTALANLAASQQANERNLAARQQTQGLNAEQGMRALLANQQASLESQRAAEQSRQFGAQQGLANLAQANQSAQTLANVGTASAQADQARYGLQTQTAAQQQALNQQRMDMAYQDFLRQRDYPMEQLQQYSSLLRGVPVALNSTSTTYAPTASLGSQLVGGGLGAASLYNTANRAGLI